MYFICVYTYISEQFSTDFVEIRKLVSTSPEDGLKFTGLNIFGHNLNMLNCPFIAFLEYIFQMDVYYFNFWVMHFGSHYCLILLVSFFFFK